MTRYMNKDEFNRYLSVTLEQMANKKQEEEVSAELASITQEKEDYTPDDVINTIVQISPEDENLARKVVEEIENKRRPRTLLVSIQDKVTLYEMVKNAKIDLNIKYSGINCRQYKQDIQKLAYQGIFDNEDVELFYDKMNLLEMIVTGNIPDGLKSEGVNESIVMPFVVAGTATELFITSAAYFLGFQELTFLVGLVGLIPSFLIGEYLSRKKAEKVVEFNIQKQKERIKNCEERFAQELLTIDCIARKFLKKINSEEIAIHNPNNEESVIESISYLQRYFSNLIKGLPELQHRYATLKNSEAGLPVQNIHLLTAKAIKGRDE